MFAGKTEELVRRIRRASIAGRRVRVLTHAIDTRSGPNRVVSHSGLAADSLPLQTSDEIAVAVPDDVEVVAIDEAHFFGPWRVAAVEKLAQRGKLVIVAGLDVTFEGQPFEPLPALMAHAERVDKLTAVCAVCGADAVYHVRNEPATAGTTELDPGHVGGAEKYQARCRRHREP